MIEMWELCGLENCRFSTFSWRTRLALHHKNLSFTVRPVTVSDKAAIAFSGQSTVPIIRIGDRVVSDSWAIAVFLEREFPDRPSLFGGDTGEQLTRFFNLWTDREIVSSLVPNLMRDVLDCVSDTDGCHLRAQIEGVFKKPLEELFSEREKALQQLRRRLQPVRKLLQEKPFLGGDTPSYADYILFGVFQWSRVVSKVEVLEAGDVVRVWFERVLDLYDGVGRKERAREERMAEVTK